MSLKLRLINKENISFASIHWTDHRILIVWCRLVAFLLFTGKFFPFTCYSETYVNANCYYFLSRKQSEGAANLSDALQPGNQIVSAGYALYGSATMIVISLGTGVTGGGVNGFTYDPSIGEFILTDVRMQIPQKGNIYSINEGYTHIWDESIKKYIEAKKDPAKGKPYGARYVGSMVADVHRTIKYGGIFLYPATSANPSGKVFNQIDCLLIV